MTTFRGLDNTDNPPFYGDGDFTATHGHGGDNDLTGGNAINGIASNTLFGDWRIMAGTARGGYDILAGGYSARGGSVINALYGDAYDMIGHAKGGNNTLSGGPASRGGATNTLYGDAYDISGNAKGGDNTLSGGSAAYGGATNTLYGDAYDMSGNAKGGDNTLSGGNADFSNVTNTLYGDAYDMSGNAKGGNNVLIAGTKDVGGVVNDMWGDGHLSGSARGGRDLFVFADNGGFIVGTQNTIHDFSQSQHDKIEFSQVAGVSSFADLNIAYAAGTATISNPSGTDQVTLTNFAGRLTAADFSFA